MKKLFVVSVLTFLLTTPVTVLAGNGGGVSGTATGSVSCTGEGTGQYSFTYVGHATAIAPFHLTFLVNNAILQSGEYSFTPENNVSLQNVGFDIPADTTYTFTVALEENDTYAVTLIDAGSGLYQNGILTGCVTPPTTTTTTTTTTTQPPEEPAFTGGDEPGYTG